MESPMDKLNNTHLQNTKENLLSVTKKFLLPNWVSLTYIESLNVYKWKAGNFTQTICYVGDFDFM
jgi:hypothetical protein